MAHATRIVLAVVVLIRISFGFGLLSFVTGVAGFILAGVGVRTGVVTRVDLPVFPVVGAPTASPRSGSEESIVEKRLSRFSLEV